MWAVLRPMHQPPSFPIWGSNMHMIACRLGMMHSQDKMGRTHDCMQDWGWVHRIRMGHRHRAAADPPRSLCCTLRAGRAHSSSSHSATHSITP